MFKTLIIDADEVCKKILERVIQSSGHLLTSCSSGELAQAAVENSEFDLILMDVNLPGMSGLDFCRWLRKHPSGKHSLVIVVTANSKSSVLQEAMDCGANDFSTKPLDVEVLKIRLSILERQLLVRRDAFKTETSLRFAEARFRQFMDQLPGLAWIKTIEGEYVYCSTQLCNMLKKPQEEITGKTDLELWESAQAEHFRHNDLEVITSHKPLETFEQTNGPEGRREWLVHKFPIEDEKGQLRWVGGLGIDITKSQKLAEENNRRSKLEAVGYLAGGIAHEFNNLLTVMMGNMSLVQLELPPNSPACEWLDNAQTSAMRATQLSKELLTFAKGGDPVKEHVELDSLVITAMNAFPKAKIILSAPLHLPLCNVDPQQITLVFRHLIENSVEARATQISFSLEQCEIPDGDPGHLPAGKYIRAVVSDNGTGISPDILPRIFDPFFSTKGAGGLGLAIAYRVARKHKGGIFALNLEKGAELTLYLPLDCRVDGPMRQKPVGNLHSRRARVLVMDDDKEIIALTSEILTRAGYMVAGARDGVHAIRAYREAQTSAEPFAAVIMDLTVPGGMGGKEAMEQLLLLDPDVKAIVCSGYSNDPVLAHFADYGFKAQISKPFTGGHLTEVLASVLEIA